VKRTTKAFVPVYFRWAPPLLVVNLKCRIDMEGGGMLSVVFWNLGKNPITLPRVQRLTETWSPDVILLAECPGDLAVLLNDLNALGCGDYREGSDPTAKVCVLTRLSRRAFVPRFRSSGGHLDIYSVCVPNLQPRQVLLAVVHLPSKAGGATPGSQLYAATTIADELAEEEDRRGHRNTVLVGDFNMNPFDPGMVSAGAIHGLMTRELAGQPDRKHLGRERRRLYNPMWGFFGDWHPGPAGTHYWASSMIENTFWAILDQVLLRPALMGRLRELVILDSDGDRPLTSSRGIPEKEHLSDHLPIIFQLDV
jgi:endonuclease/exonuclease/phosphatase family metal-dependent hydrolase